MLQQERAHALDHPQKLPLHPKVVPTNADLKRSNMIDRYAGMRDPTFHATWDLSEIAKGSDHKGKAASVFSLSRPKKKTYDVAVTNPIIAAKAAEDQGKPTHGGGAGLGGLFRRGSRSSHAPDTAAAEGGKPSLIDESRDRKALFEEAERQAAYEAQQKERRDAELAEQQEQARKKAEQDKIRRKQEAAEAKERARAEKEREREAKRQSKLTVNTVNNGPPPRYSQAQAQAAGATGHSALSSPQPNTSGEDSASPVAEADEPLHAEGHRIGDEVPTRQNANQSNFNEEFSVLGFDGCAQPVQRREEDDTSSVSSSDGSSVTEEGAADHPGEQPSPRSFSIKVMKLIVWL